MKNVFLAVIILWSALLEAQQQESRHFLWGIETGFESQLTGIQSLNTGEPDQMQVEAERRAVGGSAGIFGKWQIWRGFAVRTALSVSSVQAKIRFDKNVAQSFRFTDLEVPLHMVFTNPNGHFPLRGSLLLGGRLGWNFSAQPSDNLSLLREWLALDAGLGVEIRLKNWRLQPELVYSHGLNNLHDVVNARYDWAVGRVVRDRLTIRVLIWKFR